MQQITWTYCQVKSDEILTDGLWKLKTNHILPQTEVLYSAYGNYLLSNGGEHYYIGEGKNLFKRVKQQFNPKTTTFYKTYQKFCEKNNREKLAINDFSIQYIPTEIGRKEIEDFGIVNLATPLNKFQKGKRTKFDIESKEGLWNNVQDKKEELLKQGEKLLFAQSVLSWGDCCPEKTPGIYVLFDHDKVIYVGESSDISARYATHSNTRSTYFSAVRRNTSTDILGYQLKVKNGKKKYLTEAENIEVTKYLFGRCAIFLPVTFGRYELEEYLIKKYKPLLNRKDNRVSNLDAQ